MDERHLHPQGHAPAKLAGRGSTGTILLTDADLRVHAAANLPAAQQDQEKRALCHLLPKHKNLGMETTKELRSRFRSAFKRFSAEDTAMRKMKADLSGDNVTLGIHGINAQSRLISHAEHDYKAARLDYSDRLLSDPPEGGTG